MTRILKTLSCFFSLAFLISCQKEVSFETGQPTGPSNGGTAVYTLQGGGSTCMNSVVAGTYTQGTALTATNNVTIEVNVATIGTWSITTGSVTGFFYSGSGTFTATGVQTITLNASGTPSATGTQTFSVVVGSASCTFQVTVAGTSSGCGTAAGTYVAGTALTATNKVTVTHTYAAAGTYSATTTPVNGYSFGPLSTTVTAGQAGTSLTLVLNGTGTPTAAGTNSFTIDFGDGTNCTFTVTVTGNNPVPNTDHFPLTANSYWTYNDGYNPGDTLLWQNSNTAVFGGNTYRLFDVTEQSGNQYELYFRKSGSNYYEYTAADYYSILGFDATQLADILFLKEGLTNGTTWNSSEYTGQISGTTAKLRYVFTCTNANATVTVNGKSFSNVYNISMKPQVSVSPAPFVDDGLTWTFYYAQGIGLIYSKVTDGVDSFVQDIRYWKVL